VIITIDLQQQTPGEAPAFDDGMTQVPGILSPVALVFAYHVKDKITEKSPP
jgi:hypothetical protein